MLRNITKGRTELMKEQNNSTYSKTHKNVIYVELNIN